MFNEENSFRIMMIKITESKLFEDVILLFIVLSGIQISAENPLLDPASFKTTILSYFDFVMTTVFLLEVFIKVVAFGMYFNGASSYLRKFHNVMDLMIVVSSVMSIILKSTLSESLEVVKIMRVIRLLRPLKLISRNENLSLSVKALIVSIPTIFSLLVVTVLVMFSFGIVGVKLFKGMSFDCDTDLITGLT